MRGGIRALRLDPVPGGRGLSAGHRSDVEEDDEEEKENCVEEETGGKAAGFSTAPEKHRERIKINMFPN